MKKPKNIQCLVDWAEQYLATKKINNPRYNSEEILAYVMSDNRLNIIVNRNKIIPKKKYNEFKRLIRKRAKGEPLDYILKETNFYGISLYVDKNVLIPRNETEIMVDKILDFRNMDKNTLIIDIGTGSGAIAIALAKNINHADIIATDISKKALDIAKLNSKRLGIYKKIRFLYGRLLKPINKNIFKKYNQIILAANLPYVESKYLNNLKKQRMLYEPETALNGGQDGLKTIRKLICDLKEIKNKLSRDNVFNLYLELAESQIKKVSNIIKKNIINAKINIYKDYYKKNRIIHVMFI